MLIFIERLYQDLQGKKRGSNKVCFSFLLYYRLGLTVSLNFMLAAFRDPDGVCGLKTLLLGGSWFFRASHARMEVSVKLGVVNHNVSHQSISV